MKSSLTVTPEEVAAARNAYGDVIEPSFFKRAAPWALSALILGYLVWLWIKFGLTLELFGKGAAKLGEFVVKMLPPDPPPHRGTNDRATGGIERMIRPSVALD